jgi:actin-related protein
MESESPLSRRIQRYLDNKYRRQVADLGTCPEAEFLSLWQEGLKNGEIEGLLWAAAINPNLSKEAMDKVFADVHMLMHRQGCLVRRELRQVKQLCAENQKLAGKLRDARKRAHGATQALHTSEKAQAELERTAQALQAENKALKRDSQSQRLQKENEALRTQLEKTEYRLQTRVAAVERVKAENEQLIVELASQVEINQSMRAEIERLLQEMLRDEAQCEICPNRDLCARRVLLVGGITKLRAFYRDLVEEMGGEFEYHDGYVSSGEQALENLVGWADVVLCPVDVNSHRACLCVKETCKQWEKPYYMLSSSSVSSISRALADVAET